MLERLRMVLDRELYMSNGTRSTPTHRWHKIAETTVTAAAGCPLGNT
jgi:hypothetical protein